MNVPRLRFKDDDGREFPEWEFLELEKIVLKTNSRNKDCAISNVLTNSATQGIVNQVDYFDKDIANQNNLSNYYIVEIDDFVYNPRISSTALVGSLKRNNLAKGVMSPLYTVFRFKNGKLSFFEQYFQTTHWHSYIKSIANSGARYDRLNITNESFLSLPVPYPNFSEQTKIANFLTAIDEKITQLTQKVDLLAKYKKGVMQQIFSQQLRFKDDDGREFPEWDFLELEKIALKINSRNKDCAISNVLTNSATQGIVNQVDYFDKDIANQNNLSNYYVVEIDDFVYNPRISSTALVGSLKRNNLIKGVMSPLYTVFRFKNGNLSFFEQYFQTIHWHDYIKSVANSGARHDRLNITNESFFSLPVPYPIFPEQTKIANFLTALDDKIHNTQKQLDATKQYKQGLLQQLFV